MIDNLTRRTAVAAALAALGAGAACAQRPPAGVRSDLYNLENADHSLEWDARTIAWRTRIAGPGEAGEPFSFSGHALSAETGEPVGGVVIQAWHTDRSGVYPMGGSPRRIRLRAWTRTGADGRYAFDTIKPGIYPTRASPAHVHMVVIEPGRRPYYIDDIVFEGEYGVTPAYRAKQEFRGGPGIVQLSKNASGVLSAVRDIRLERHPV